MVFGVGQFNDVINIYPWLIPIANKIWDKMGHNSATLKDNCALFALTPIFGPGLSDDII